MSDDVWSDLRRHWTESAEKEKPQREAWAAPQMAEICRLTTELRNAGWRDAHFCPKDGTPFLAWEPTMRTPYPCHYTGEWPDGTWWAHMHGDVWPARPVLFKHMPEGE